MREGVPKVCVMSEHMTGEERRNSGTAGSSIEHENQNTNI